MVNHLATTAFIQMGFKLMTAEDREHDAAAEEGVYVRVTVDTRTVWRPSEGVLVVEDLNSADFIQFERGSSAVTCGRVE